MNSTMRMVCAKTVIIKKAGQRRHLNALILIGYCMLRDYARTVTYLGITELREGEESQKKKEPQMRTVLNDKSLLYIIILIQCLSSLWHYRKIKY